MEDFDIITSYKEMKSIKKICEELEVDYSNLMNGKATKENEKKVASINGGKLNGYKTSPL